MAKTSLPSLHPLLLTTVLLLFGGGQAAYLQEPENPGIFQEDRPSGKVQYYEPFRSYPLKDKAQSQLFENHNHYGQDKLVTHGTAQIESLLSETEEIAAVSSDTCADEYKAQLKKMEAMKKSCNSAGFHDCCQVKKLIPKASSGIFDFRIFCGDPSEPFSSDGTDYTLYAPCDMDTDGGGWMVIQRRVPGGKVNFTRDWQDYENGFGNLNGEFWYGLRNLHCLTTREEVELRIDMVFKKTSTKMWWTYQTFKVASAGDKYRLTIGGGKGSGRYDAMAYHNGMQFTTYDQDNDKWGKNCAYAYQGGWWYKGCYYTNFNGPHDTPSWAGVNQGHAKIIWNDSKAVHELSSVEMKIRVKKCHE